MDEEVYTDGFGNYFDAYGRTLDINDLIGRGIDVLGAWSSRSPYYSADDPRYRNQQGRYPQGYPQGGFPVGGSIPGAVNPQGFQLNWWAAALIGVVAGAFLLGKGRR
ncbi:MAG: hypothetical protein ACKVZH_06765 [Blastocatellia bacterium]